MPFFPTLLRRRPPPWKICWNIRANRWCAAAIPSTTATRQKAALPCSTKDDAEKTADRVLVQILSTDETLPPKDRMIKKTEKNGLYEALNIASIWLERSLNPSA